MTENLRLDGEVACRELEVDSGVVIETLTLAAQAKRSFFVAGMCVTFGADTLLAEDRYGATMDTQRTNCILY